MNTTRAAAEVHSSGGVSPITREAAGASASAPPTGFTFTPVLRGYESTGVGRSGLRGKEPQIEPRHGHGACPRAAKARPADAAPPPHFSTPRQPLGAACAAGDVPADFSEWRHIGEIASTAVWDEANRAKDRQDEAIDAMRVSNGMTLDEYLASK